MRKNMFLPKSLHLIRQKPNESTSTTVLSIRYQKDFFNICFLMFLYLLQGVPIGLMSSLPFIFSSRNVSYADQGTFSLSSWPYSMKLLWAPIVDSVFSRRLGRRKSWLIPVQYLIGACMFFFADYVHKTLEASDVVIHAEIYKLTGIFFLFTFLAATQDVAVDGWGLTLFSKENLEWASICNNAGATAGALIGHSAFLVLQSTSFCNDFIRPVFDLPTQSHPLVNLSQFMHFFGLVYMISTTLILILKNEKNKAYDEQLTDKLSVSSTYKDLWKLLNLEPIQQFLIILFTCKIAFATSNIRSLKMIEAGVPKEKLGLMSAPFQIIQILTPIFFGNLANVSKPLDVFLKIYPMRMVVTLFLTIWVFITPLLKDENDHYSLVYFITYAVLNGVYSLIFSALAMSKILFFTQVSDKKIGGTYMTLLNTVSNIGVAWPYTLVLYLMDGMSIKACEDTINSRLRNISLVDHKQYLAIMNAIDGNNCRGQSQTEACLSFGAVCVFWVDAYYTLTGLCLLIGVYWLCYYTKIIKQLQRLHKSLWRVSVTSSKIVTSS